MKSKNLKNLRFAKTLCMLLLALIFSGCAQRGVVKRDVPTDPLARLAAEIESALADPVMRQTRAGIKVVSLETGETLYARNNQLLFTPASNMKLLSTATALRALGPNYRYLTSAFGDSGAFTGGVLNGNLYLKGSGNPDLTIDNLRQMVRDLKQRGLNTISGAIVCDESFMDDLYWGAGWMWDDVSDWYYAPVSALTVNDNCVDIIVSPADSVGKPLQVIMAPQTRYMQVDNRATTLAATDSSTRREFRVQRVWRPVAKNVIEIEGGRFNDDSPRKYTIDVVDAALFTGTLFAELLGESGIYVLGSVQHGITPENAQLLAQHESEPLTEIILNTNKVSDNLSAELLLKLAGATVFGAPGNAEKGLSAVRRFLAEAGVDSSTYRIADGSGLSRYNIITPDLIVALLVAMDNDARVSAEFRTSLPIAGVDGTIERRMRGTAAEGKLRAKTGTLGGLSALSGYTTSADGEKLAFSIMTEHYVLPSSAIRAVQDRIGAAISSFSRR